MKALFWRAWFLALLVAAVVLYAITRSSAVRRLAAWRNRRHVSRCVRCGAARLATTELPEWAFAGRANDGAGRTVN